MAIAVVLGSQGQIGADHFHGAVSEESLEGVSVAAVSDEVDGKGVAEAVDVGMGDVGPGPDAVNEVIEAIAAEGTALLGDE